MSTLLATTGLSKRYGSVEALRDVDLSVAAGTVHCVLGENGAGKSTLCNLVNGGVRPSTGTMTLRGEAYAPGSPADALRRGVAMVHQHFSLVETMTVRENLLLAQGRAAGPGPRRSPSGSTGSPTSSACASTQARASRSCRSVPGRRSRSSRPSCPTPAWSCSTSPPACSTRPGSTR